MVAGRRAGAFAGGVNETVARLPSALAAIGLVLGVAVLAARHYGPSIGLLAGAVQAHDGLDRDARPDWPRPTSCWRV